MPVPRLLSTAAWQARPLSSPTSSCAGTVASKKAGENIVVKRNLKVGTWWKPSLISLLLLTLTLVHKWGNKATLLHSLQELPLDIYFLYSQVVPANIIYKQLVPANTGCCSQVSGRKQRKYLEPKLRRKKDLHLISNLLLSLSERQSAVNIFFR